MVLDTLDISDGTPLSADVCIIGAGAAGISAALALRNSGLSILLLESGGRQTEADSQALYEGHVADSAMHPPLVRYRQRRFGGSTTIWGGRCMPFDPIDFERRLYMDHSGWPIGRFELDPFYVEANRLCEAGEFAYTAEKAFPRGMKPMLNGFDAAHFTTDHLERISCPTDFGKRYGRQIEASRDIRLLLHANVTDLVLDAGGTKIEKVQVRTLQGKRVLVDAKWFILAAGGLEVTRLLLASRSLRERRIGDLGGVLGRFYMCHIAGIIGTVRIASHARGWHGYELSDDGVYCRRRFALTEAAQRQTGAGNFIARLNFPRITDPTHRNGFLSLLYLAKWLVPYEYGKRLHGDQRASAAELARHLRNVVVDFPATAGFGWHILRDRIMAERKFPSLIFHSPEGAFSLDFHAEQFPNPDSRVSLAHDVDSLGMPKLIVDWRYMRRDVEGVTAALRLLADDLQRTGAGWFDFKEDEVETEMTRYGAYGGHHIGTTRMAENPCHGVVDAQCRVHGCPNLYVASSSVFPTSSQANPTLTIVALALRVSAHVRRSARPQVIAPQLLPQVVDLA